MSGVIPAITLPIELNRASLLLYCILAMYVFIVIVANEVLFSKWNTVSNP